MKPVKFVITRRNVGELTRKRETLTCDTDYFNARKAAEDMSNFATNVLGENKELGMEIERATVMLPDKDVELKLPTHRIPFLKEDDYLQIIVVLRGI